MTRTTPETTEQGSNRKVVLVTGATSGIGEGIARRLAAEGHHVVAGGRREDRLTSLAESVRAEGGSIDVRRLDVTDRADVAGFVDETVTARGHIDVIVNNAGVMPLSRLDSLLVDEWDRMIDVNVKGLLHGIAAAMPHFQRQNSGHFITIASIGAYSVVPTAAVYCATKYAAWAITEGLRQEAEPFIRVTTVSPGVVESELADTITEPEAAAAMKAYRSAAISPDAIARAISYAISQPADVDVNELVIRPVRQRP